MDRYHTVTAIVINKKQIKENDLLITLLTPDEGKIVALAKGATNIKSRRLSSLQLGNIIKAHIYKKNDHSWISETTVIVPFLNQPKNLSQLGLLFYFLELINRFIAENQQIDGCYSVSQNIILAINRHHVPNFIQNEIALLHLLGFGQPPSIIELFKSQDYKNCQKQLKLHFESILEKPLESNKLFN
jgi:DNA repair protein RecO (recombination protein O)